MTEKQDPNSQHVLDLIAEESTLQEEVKQYLSSLSKGSRVKMHLQESTIKKIIQTAIQEINQRHKVAKENPGGDQDPIQEESHIAFYQVTQTLQEAQHSPSLFDKQELEVITTFIRETAMMTPPILKPGTLCVISTGTLFLSM